MNVGTLEEIHTKIYQNNDLENQDSTQSGDDDEAEFRHHILADQFLIFLLVYRCI
jgi:hypothetical protein